MTLVAHATPGAGGLDSLLLVTVAAVAAAWGWAVMRVNAAHPRSPVPPWRAASFLAGVTVLVLALQGPIDTFADDLFSVHLVQHVLIGFVAAPLLVLGSPVLLVMRLVPGDVRRGVLLPLVRTAPVAAMTYPPLTWLLFGVTMWLVHFSPLYELALESEAIHRLEHLLILGTAVLYWLPALGEEPLAHRLSWSRRFFYVFLGMPVSSVLGLVIASETMVLYPAYAAAADATTALADQRLAGAIMWVGTDLIGIVLLGLLIARWARAEAARPSRRLA
jgi:putative copper resistance protein D